MTAEDSKRLEVREIIRDTLAHHGHEGDELLEAPATHAAAAVGGPMTDIVARLRDQCCRLGHDDHGHTNCWLFGRAAAEIERLREETTTLRERTTPPDDIDVASLVDLLRDLAHDETDSLVDAALAIEHAYLSGDTPRGAAGE